MASRKALSADTVTTALRAVETQIGSDAKRSIDESQKLFIARHELQTMAAKNGISPARVTASTPKPPKAKADKAPTEPGDGASTTQ